MPAILFIIALLAAAPLFSAEPPAPLASRYPGDVNIHADPAVLFSDNFESGSTARWDERQGPAAVVPDDPHAGRFCVHMPMHRGKDTGSKLVKWFLPGADTVHVRFYVKFSSDYQYSHHFVTLLANQKSNKWSAFGKAGLKPDGATWFVTALEPWFAWGKNPPPGEIAFYSYYMDMEPDRKMNKYWGNSFFPPGPGKGAAASPLRVIPPLNQWQCWEFMLRANSPGRADGAQAFWVDGKRIAEFTNLRWRTDPSLKPNCLWLEHFGYDSSDPTRQFWKNQQAVWFDDLVIARSYIGPLTPPH